MNFLIQGQSGRPRGARAFLLAALILGATSARAAWEGAGPLPRIDLPRDAPVLLRPAKLRLVAFASEAPPPPDPSLDFDLLGAPTGAASPEEVATLTSRVNRRRFMLSWHQAVGLSTLALLAGTVTVGELNYQDRFSAHAPGTGRFEQLHAILAFTTVTGFAATGALALLAPVPYEKRFKADTAFLHKMLMLGAALGMASEVGFGLYTAGREGYANQATFAGVHQVIGFLSLAFMASGAGVWIF